MKIQKQVCNLELSKELKKLGVKQESLFYWVDNSVLSEAYVLEQNNNDDFSLVLNNGEQKYYKKDLGVYSAFTASELGEMLPKKRWDVHKSLDNKKEWISWYSRDVHIFYAETEVDCRTKMLIYLIKNKLIRNEAKI